jgi:uncharacterized protein YktA (UPF0223 family)
MFLSKLKAKYKVNAGIEDKKLIKEFSARKRLLKSKEEAKKLLDDIDKAAEEGKIRYKTASGFIGMIHDKWFPL